MPRVKAPARADYTIENYDFGPGPSESQITSCLDVKSDVDGGVRISDDGDTFDMQTGGAAVPVSFSFWHHIAADQGTGVQFLFGKYSQLNSVQRSYYLTLSSDESISFDYYDTDGDRSTVQTAASAHPLGSWAHIVVTVDPDLGSNQEKIYINGVLAKTETADADQDLSRDSTEELYIGNLYRAGGFPSHGQYSNFVMYKHAAGTGALTAAQVSTIYSQGRVLADPISGPRGYEIVAWYKFDGNANDSSGNGRHGTDDTSATYATPDSILFNFSSVYHRRPANEVISGQKEQTLPFIFGVKGFPSLRRAPQV